MRFQIVNVAVGMLMLCAVPVSGQVVDQGRADIEVVALYNLAKIAGVQAEYAMAQPRRRGQPLQAWSGSGWVR